MKVSNNINVTSIYQEQLRKLQNAKPSEFGKLMGERVSNESQASQSYDEPLKAAANNQPKVNLAELLGNEPAAKTPEELLSFAAEKVAGESDIRFEKVNQIKSLVDAGQYNVSPMAVAEKLWSSGVVTHVW